MNGIHERWRRSEVVKIVCEDICRMNMKRTHDLLEVSLHFSNYDSSVSYSFVLVTPTYPTIQF